MRPDPIVALVPQHVVISDKPRIADLGQVEHLVDPVWPGVG